MSLFNYKSYRAYLKAYIRALPQKGRGEISRIAAALKIQSTLLSMILSGSRDFSVEQALDLSTYLNHTELEAEYFLLLVQLERAGNHRLKNYLLKRVEKIQLESKKVEHRFEYDRKLTDDERTIFYSSWIYSAIRLSCSLTKNGKTINEIMARFEIPRARALEIVQFLSSTGLIIEKNDRYQIGISRTYLEKESFHLPRHHTNWRLKALQKSDRISDHELMFTFPLSISKADFEIIRNEILEVLKKASNIVKDSPPDEIGCLNVDLFWVDK